MNMEHSGLFLSTEEKEAANKDRCVVFFTLTSATDTLRHLIKHNMKHDLKHISVLRSLPAYFGGVPLAWRLEVAALDSNFGDKGVFEHVDLRLICDATLVEGNRSQIGLFNDECSDESDDDGSEEEEEDIDDDGSEEEEEEEEDADDDKSEEEREATNENYCYNCGRSSPKVDSDDETTLDEEEEEEEQEHDGEEKGEEEEMDEEERLAYYESQVKPPLWSCKVASYTLSICREGKEEEVSESDFYYSPICYSSETLRIYLKKLLNPKNGYLKDDTLVFKAEFTIDAVDLPVLEVDPFPFLNAQHVNNDVCLLVEGRRLFANRGLLAVNSEFFTSMFNTKWMESRMDEIPLADVGYDEFVELLLILYPNRKSIDQHNVELILKLADRYLMQSLVNQCELFLMTRCHECPLYPLPLSKCLLIAETYPQLSVLKRKCLKALYIQAEMETLEDSDTESQFGD